MSTFPEFLYRLTPRDEQVTPLEIVRFSDSVASASNFHTGANYTVPLGKNLLIKHMTVFAQAGAGQKPVYATVESDSGYGIFFGQHFGSTVAQYGFASISGDLHILTEGETLFASAFYDAGVALNTTRFWMRGILIPRGNFAI